MGTNRDLIENARLFAIGAHRRINQRRKYSYQPYEVHLKSVADIVSQVTKNQNMISAAWLHDVVEDTPATFEDIERIFGNDIAYLVHELTDVSTYDDGNRALRKCIDRDHIAKASDQAKIVKLADLIDNCTDICANDVGFGRVFLNEMKALLDIISEDLPLYRRAKRTHDKWKSVLDKSGKNDKDTKAERTWWNLINQSKQRSIKKALKFLMTNFSASDIARPFTGFKPGIPQDHIIDIAAPLSLAVNILTYYDYCYVEKDGKISMQIERLDFEVPIARTWIAGIIILYDQTVTDIILGLWPDNTWQAQLSASRLKKAEEMAAERKRRKQSAQLIDCLQFSDKLHILGKDKKIARMMGFPSTSAAKRVHHDLETLRNNLAHGQKLSTDCWAQIARLSETITEILYFREYQ